MGTPAVGDLVLGSHSSEIQEDGEQEEAGEDGGHEDSKIEALISGGSKHQDGCAGGEMAALPSEVARDASQQRSKHTTSRSVDAKKSLLLKEKQSVVNALEPQAKKRRKSCAANAPDPPTEKQRNSSAVNDPNPPTKKPRKSSAVNAPEPPKEKRRKPSALHVQFVRSPLLNTIIASPRIRHYGAKHQRSPNVIRDEPSAEIGSAGAFCSNKFFQRDRLGNDAIHMGTQPFEALPEDADQQMSKQRQALEDATSRSMAVMQSLMLKRNSSAINASRPPGGMQSKSSTSCLKYVRSPVLNRMLQSPSMRMSQSGTLSARSSSPSSSDETRMSTSPNLGPGSSRPIRRRKLRFDVWKEFEPIYDGNLVVQAKCIHCLELFSATRDNGRSACRRHLKVCKERTRMNQLVESMNTGLSPDSLALKNWKFDQEVSRKAMVNFIVLQELPFSLVDHAPFQKFIATLNPWFTIVSRTTVAEDIMSSYEEQRLALRETIKKSDSRVCLTADLWTSNQNLGYLCITCHFIDNDWKLPTIDVPTRWNSTYLMLKSAKEYRAAFDVLDLQDPNYLDKPSNADWNMADLLCQVFEPFYAATNVVSGTLYPTGNRTFHVLWQVKKRIETEELSQDVSIAVMAKKMKQKFMKYWDLCYLPICIPVVLDPRFKLSFISFRLNAGFGEKGPGYTAMVKHTLENLFSAYLAMEPEVNYSQPEPDVGGTDEDDSWADFEQHLAAQRRKEVQNELDTYLQDDLFPRQKNLDILQWWMMHSSKYPVVSRMARDIFAAPASIVASESAFSTTGRIVSDYRSRLTSKKVQALVCLQDWLKAEGLSDVKLSEDDNGNGDDQDAAAEV